MKKSHIAAWLAAAVLTGSLMAGQTAGQVKEIRPLRAIIEDICTGKKDS